MQSHKKLRELDAAAERIVFPKGGQECGSSRQPAPLAGEPKESYWAEVRNGKGEITAYIELFWGGKLGWVSVPGASRVIDAGSRKAQ